MLNWLRRQTKIQPDEQRKVTAYLNPLHALLHAAEKSKGSPLTEAEVLQVRDTTIAVEMTEEQAAMFYMSLDAQVEVYRMNPDRIWEEWQEIRAHVT
ncbi:hypothetical protein D3C71_1252000 [compost metagenome]